jgi:ATPase family AAA domain-containing protein 3A/B
MQQFFCFILFHFLSLCIADSSNQPFILYADIKSVNKTECLNRIKHAPIVHYKFLYDSVVERIHLGIIGPDAQRFFPESIEVVSNYALPSRDKSKASIVLNNFPVVDKNVIFFHGMAALQELISNFEDLNKTIIGLNQRDDEVLLFFKRVEEELKQDVDQQLIERIELLKLESELAKKELEFNSFRLESERFLIEKQLEGEKEMLNYEEELTKKRLAQQEELAKENAVNFIKMEKELAIQREKMHHETAESLHKLKQEQNKQMDEKKLEFEKDRIKAELEAKAQQERANADITIRKLQAQSKLDTDRLVEGIKTISKQISVVVNNVFSKPKQIIVICSLFFLLFLSYYIIKELVSMIRQIIQSQIGKPSLVRETSFHWSIIPRFIVQFFSRKEITSKSIKFLKDQFKDIILSEADKERVITLALATRNTKESGAPFRHILLHGNPGTGKTLIARKLATCSGMDYAIMSGGDVAPLGEDAVNQLHSLFKWASRSRKGLLVFIDEAEAFLGSRNTVNNNDALADNNIRNALNALLYQTGSPSKSFMLILATNRPEDLDAAILDRIDVSLHVSLPGLQQRKELIDLYMSLHVVKKAEQLARKKWLRYLSFFSAKNSSENLCNGVSNECLNENTVSKIAEKMEDFSGREISKLFISVQYAMFLAENNFLTLQNFLNIVDEKVDEHKFKNGLNSLNKR